MNRTQSMLITCGAIVLGIVIAVFTAPLTAHGGGLDAVGGHRDTKAGNYHVHQGSCSGRTFASKERAVAAGCKRS